MIHQAPVTDYRSVLGDKSHMYVFSDILFFISQWQYLKMAPGDMLCYF